MARVRVQVDGSRRDVELARVPVAGDFIRLMHSKTVEARAVRLLPAGAEDWDAEVVATKVEEDAATLAGFAAGADD